MKRDEKEELLFVFEDNSYRAEGWRFASSNMAGDDIFVGEVHIRELGHGDRPTLWRFTGSSCSELPSLVDSAIGQLQSIAQEYEIENF